MLLSLEKDNLTLLNAQDGTALISHKLSRIRVWGTGKEANRWVSIADLFLDHKNQ